MALPPIRASRKTGLPELTREDVSQTYLGYWDALETLTLPELMAESTRLAALIEQGQRAQMNSLLQWDPSRGLDQPVLSSMTKATPPPPRSGERSPDRGAAASMPRSSRPLVPGPVEILMGQRQMGPTLAARLVNHAVRRREADRSQS